ncbi:MAG TPA: trypsin-like peptidase domain-containing protein [Nocardioidaceae bacterium]|nr:trypsin-like peptidase domain-containing protein [Nocardioidaceae bacterium]
MSDNEPGRPEQRDEDTAPLWSRDEAAPPPHPGDPSTGPDADAGSYDPQGQQSEGYQSDAYQRTAAYPQQQDPYAYPSYGYDPYGYNSGWQQPEYLPYQQGWPQQRSGPKLPGWLWPVVAATALVVGLLGGAMSGALVSGTVDRTAGPSVFEGDQAAPAPLEPENGSVAAVAQALLPSTVQVIARGGAGAGTGSGFVVDRQGHVITNNHVVSGAAENDGRIQVIDHSGRRLLASIVGRSATYDIAVLDVEGAEDLQPAALGSSQSMNVGETVVALGSPLGLSSTVTSGIVSALDRPVTTGDSEESSYINAVQTDAAINPGNSGGPLVNLRGEVVGVNSAIATVGGFASKAGNIGVGFAIPMEQVEVTASQIVQTGEAKYPVIGAEVNTGSRANGAEIVRVPAGTPADRAGLEEGDIVVAVEDKAVNDGIGLIVAIRSHQPGETIRLTVRRGGSEETVQITLDAQVG